MFKYFSRTKSITVFLSVIASFLIITSQSMADTYAGSKAHPITTAWYSPSVSAYGYTPTFDDGRAYWNDVYIGVHVYKNTGTYQTGQDKYFVGDFNAGDSRYLGQTTAYYKNTFGNIELADPNGYWDYVIVTIYDGAMRKSPYYGYSTVRMNAAHEIGHSLKMNHAPGNNLYSNSICGYSVMLQGFFPIPASITSYDKSEFLSKWD